MDSFIGLLNPEKRLFIGYLLSAAVIALLFYRFSMKRPLAESARGLFSSAIWWSRSARADYTLILINQLLIRIWSPWMVSQLAVTLAVFEAMHGVSSRTLLQQTPEWGVIAGFTLVLFLLDDYTRFLIHRMMHRVSWLWRFHQVHHSATNLTPFTVLRTHPLEAILFSLRSVLVHATTLGVFYFYFGDRVSLFELFGASIFTILFHGLGSNLRHSHVPFGYWRWLEKILISPVQHQLHHSSARDHFDCNFGAALALWDRMGGSLQHQQQGRQIVMGVAHAESVDPHSVRQLLIPSRGSD